MRDTQLLRFAPHCMSFNLIIFFVTLLINFWADELRSLPLPNQYNAFLGDEKVCYCLFYFLKYKINSKKFEYILFSSLGKTVY
jgi:hypothetical protein